MEFVGDVKFGSGESVGSEHGLPSVHECEAFFVGGAVGSDERVGFDPVVADNPACRTGLDPDEDYFGGGECRVNFRAQSFEIGGDGLGRFASFEVVVAGVDDDGAGLVGRTMRSA